MNKIIVFDNSCKLFSNDAELYQQLNKLLSFTIQGAEFSQAYKGHINEFGDFVSWDGRRYLMSSTGKFPIGLLQRVLKFFEEKKIEVEIVDNKNSKTPIKEIDISKKLKDINMVPRPYQINIANEAVKHDRGIIKAATGCGKTLCTTLITAKFGKPTLIMVIGTDLLYQTHNVFSKIFDEEIGIIGDGHCNIKNINIASVWTISSALGIMEKCSLDDSDEKEKEVSSEKFQDIKKMLLSARVVIIDEAHVCAAPTLVGISQNIKAEHVYGMSASPWRDDNQDMLIEAFLGKRIIDLSAKDLIKQGYLVKPIIRFLVPKYYPYKSGVYQKIYAKYITENEQRNGMIVTGAIKMIEQGLVPLVLFNSIKHGDILYKQLKDKVPTALLSGKHPSKVREKIKKDIENGKIKCIIASKIFDWGLDLPILSGLIIGSAGKSSVRALQRIGRVIRPYPGKKFAAIIDFADQAPYLCEHAKKRKEIYETEFEVQWPLKD
jgi:superfamily II DNA or RNA helicase